ncbi:MAG: DUF1638 domain-containing protein [Rhodospirillales bacterium]|nr:DUF1638 domain-containing protein [Rhodospirillales bacterium]
MAEPKPQHPPKTLLIACGALAREILMVIEVNNWKHVEVTCLPASFHNYPERITDAMRDKIRENRPDFEQIIALFADCGTGGMLDRMLEEEGVVRIPGAHCYEFYATSEKFHPMAEQELGTFYLTDYLARQFDVLIMEGMGLNKHPELMPMYFGNYKRLVYLAQTDDAALQEKAKAAAEKLGLTYEYVFTGLGGLRGFLEGQNPDNDMQEQ